MFIIFADLEMAPQVPDLGSETSACRFSPFAGGKLQTGNGWEWYREFPVPGSSPEMVVKSKGIPLISQKSRLVKYDVIWPKNIYCLPLL